MRETREMTNIAADFEKLRKPTEKVEDCGDEMGSGNMLLRGCLSRFSYLRYALAAGTAEVSSNAHKQSQCLSKLRIYITPRPFGRVSEMSNKR